MEAIFCDLFSRVHLLFLPDIRFVSKDKEMLRFSVVVKQCTQSFWKPLFCPFAESGVLKIYKNYLNFKINA